MQPAIAKSLCTPGLAEHFAYGIRWLSEIFRLALY